MTPHATELINSKDIEIFWKIRSLVEKLPDFDYGDNHNGEKIVLSCHMLARAVARAFMLKLVDGKYLNQYDHSWVMTEQGNIIDVYPIGVIGGPILVEGESSRLSSRLYFPMSEEKAKEYYSHLLKRTWFERSTDLISRHIIRTTLSAV